MVTVLTKQYKVVCDRCGKTEYADNKPENHCKELAMGHYDVNFGTAERIVAKGGVCRECYKEFCELAVNFFDEVNKENEGKPKEKPDAIIITRESNAFFGELYKCPLCGGTFGSFEVDKKDVRCPHCKAELRCIK